VFAHFRLFPDVDAVRMRVGHAELIHAFVYLPSPFIK
jgi:hypothetical protein